MTKRWLLNESEKPRPQPVPWIFENNQEYKMKLLFFETLDGVENNVPSFGLVTLNIDYIVSAEFKSVDYTQKGEEYEICYYFVTMSTGDTYSICDTCEPIENFGHFGEYIDHVLSYSRKAK